jgi:cytochrome P450
MNADARELAASFDIEKLTPEFYADPYPTYRALREHEPVKRMANGSWFLTRYDDLVSAYKSTKVFSSDKKKEFFPKYGDSPLYEHHTTSLVFNDPPAHSRVRRLIMGALSPRAIAGMEPDLIVLVDRLIAAIAAKGSVDLIDDFAAAIPIEVIGNLLDVPQEERGRAGDRPGGFCPRQPGGAGFSRLSGSPGSATTRQARQPRARRADPPHSERGQWRAADREGTAAQLHLPAQRRA